jgi:hypothetical protein
LIQYISGYGNFTFLEILFPSQLRLHISGMVNWFACSAARAKQWNSFDINTVWILLNFSYSNAVWHWVTYCVYMLRPDFRNRARELL